MIGLHDHQPGRCLSFGAEREASPGLRSTDACACDIEQWSFPFLPSWPVIEALSPFSGKQFTLLGRCRRPSAGVIQEHWGSGIAQYAQDAVAGTCSRMQKRAVAVQRRSCKIVSCKLQRVQLQAETRPDRRRTAAAHFSHLQSATRSDSRRTAAACFCIRKQVR